MPRSTFVLPSARWAMTCLLATGTMSFASDSCSSSVCVGDTMGDAQVDSTESHLAEVVNLLQTSLKPSRVVVQPPRQFQASIPCESKYSFPDLLYLGPGHSGSTSLADQMNLHTELSYGITKEHHYFAVMRAEPMEERPPNSYKQEFTTGCGVKVAFDADPATFLISNPEVPNTSAQFRYEPGPTGVQEIKSLLGPSLLLMAMFRDPVEQAESFVQNKYPRSNLTQRQADLVHAEALHLLDSRWHSCHADNLQRWLDVFGREQFLFLDSASYFNDPQGTLDEVLRFVGASPRNYSDQELGASGRRRSTSNKPYLTTSERIAYHRSDEARLCKSRLEAMTGLRFDWKHAD